MLLRYNDNSKIITLNEPIFLRMNNTIRRKIAKQISCLEALEKEVLDLNTDVRNEVLLDQLKELQNKAERIRFTIDEIGSAEVRRAEKYRERFPNSKIGDQIEQAAFLIHEAVYDFIMKDDIEIWIERLENNSKIDLSCYSLKSIVEKLKTASI